MNKKNIENLVNQLSKGECYELGKYIQKRYAVSIDHDIENRVCKLFDMLFDMKVHKDQSFMVLDVDAIDVAALSDSVIREFDLDGIEFSNVMEWQSVSDVIDYLGGHYE